MNAVARTTLVYADGTPIPVRDQPRAVPKASLAVPDRRFGGSLNAFDAANLFARETRDWFPSLRSADSEMVYDADVIRARHRDLYRNDGYANGSAHRLADAVPGVSFHPIPEPNFRALAAASNNPAYDATWAAEYRDYVMAAYRMWADDPNFYCDATRSMTIGQQFYVAYLHKLIDGDALGMPLWLPDNIGYGAARYATTLQVIDPDRLSNPNGVPDTLTTRAGVEIDGNGAPIGYHIRRAHPYDWYATGAAQVWDYFDRQTAWGRPLVVHDCDRVRAQQHRGLGFLTSVLGQFKTLAKHGQTALQAAINRTMVGFFVRSPGDPDQMNQALTGQMIDEGSGQAVLDGYQTFRATFGNPDGLYMGNVKIPVLGPGESVESAHVPGQADDFDAFQHAFLRGIAAATGESSEEVTKDYRETNYSSARAALLSYWRSVQRRRANFAHGFCNPIYVAWLEEVHDRDAGKVPLPLGGIVPDFVEMRAAYGRCEWIGPGRGWIDPVKERQGEVLGLDAAFGTLKETCANISGRYFMDVLDQRAVEVAAMKARGLTLPDWSGANPQADQANLVEEKPKPQ